MEDTPVREGAEGDAVAHRPSIVRRHRTRARRRRIGRHGRAILV